jgi:DNA-binding beta-propeller fold protein YncE
MLLQKLLGATAVTDKEWNLAFASYSGVSFSVNAEETFPTGIFFKPDGLKMYIVGNGGDEVNEYTLSSAWNISTASYIQDFSVAAQDSNPQCLFFKPDGTKMYILGGAGDEVNEYTLSSAWNISTASYAQNFSVAAQETQPGGLFFKPDGTNMYVIGANSDNVNDYALSTAWDISTASFVESFNVNTQAPAPTSVFFRNDGLRMYVLDSNQDAVNQYSLSTPWDISTAFYFRKFSVASQETNPNGLFFKPDGTEMYVVGLIQKTIYAYDIG